MQTYRQMTLSARLFLYYLARLKLLLQRVASFDGAMMARRLHPEMAPLLQQARSAIGFTLRATCPLAGRDIVSFAGDALTLHAVLSELDATVAYLAALPEPDCAPMQVQTMAGCAALTLPAQDYFLLYAVPNFFFHYSMVYAIARQAGVPIGKADFDGYHLYPQGFSFGEVPTLSPSTSTGIDPCNS